MCKKAKCPICKEKIELDDDLDVGDIFYCSECYGDVKIAKMNPLVVEEVSEANYDEDSEEE